MSVILEKFRERIEKYITRIVNNNACKMYAIYASKSFTKRTKKQMSNKVMRLHVSVIVQEIIKNITEGAFNLFDNIFPTLESVVEGIRLKNPLLRDMIKPSLRDSIQIAAMLYLTENKENALAWFENSAPEEKDKRVFLEKMKNNWK
jgi:hypothetical protein